MPEFAPAGDRSLVAESMPCFGYGLGREVRAFGGLGAEPRSLLETRMVTLRLKSRGQV
jgi:hypothetical protein